MLLQNLKLISLLTIPNILPLLLITFFCLQTLCFRLLMSYLVSSNLVSSSVCTRLCFRLLRLISYHLISYLLLSADVSVFVFFVLSRIIFSCIFFCQQACLSRSDLFVSISPQYPDGLFSLTLLFKLELCKSQIFKLTSINSSIKYCNFGNFFCTPSFKNTYLLP